MTQIANDIIDAVARHRNTDRNNLHEIEHEEVAFNRDGLMTLAKCGRELLAGAMGAGAVKSLTLGEIVAIFAHKLFWNEVGGELILCAQIGDRAMCLSVPAEQWNVVVNGSVQ